MRTPVGREPPLPGDNSVEYYRRKAKDLEREAKIAISTSRTWNYEKLLGHGSSGVAMLLVERDLLRSRRPRRAVLKLPLETATGVGDLIREARALDFLRGHAHIAQRISFTEDVSSFQPRGGRIRRILRRVVNSFRNPPDNLFVYLSRLNRSDRPALLLEYLENGNLIRIVEQIYDRDLRLPNRLLWGWYHCLVSACVAMTYAREGPIDQPMKLEVPRRDQQHLRLAHHDIAFRNVVMDEVDPRVQEHRVTPKLVLIDFGMARQGPSGRDAEDSNLEAVNTLMLDLIDPSMLINNRGFHPVESDNGFRTMAAGLFNKARLPRLDPELQTLLAHSFRIGADGEPFQRLSLEQTFAHTRRGMLKPAESYDGQVQESDNYIQAQLQRLLFDAEW
ncbi:hypothetical protein F4680DRAFT_442611 [Xylaria scruposa]|nr:hypothetical protein F4680DRAFT_442611 [Xylaria scruposa]